MVEQENFDKLMAEIRQSRNDVESKLASTVADLKREVTTAQEKTSLDFAQKMASSSQQFRKKSHEHQFTFNTELQGTFTSVKMELDKVDATTEEDRASLRRAQLQLDEGLKALATRQKFIKIEDCSKFGWATVKFYQSDPLASDSEDEKDLGRAEKEARKDAERQMAKQQCGKQPASVKRPRLSQWPDQGASASEVAPVVNPRLGQPRPPKPSSGPPGPCW